MHTVAKTIGGYTISSPTSIAPILQQGEVIIDPCKFRWEVANSSMKSLYSVVLVWIDGTIEIDVKVVAKNEEEAKFKAGVYSLIAENSSVELSEVTVIVTNLGSVKIKDKE